MSSALCKELFQVHLDGFISYITLANRGQGVLRCGNRQRETSLWVILVGSPSAWHSTSSSFPSLLLSSLLFLPLSPHLLHLLVSSAQMFHIFPSSDHPLNTYSCVFVHFSLLLLTYHPPSPFSYQSGEYQRPVESEYQLHLDFGEGTI